jgi:hypothetical protein
MSYIYRNIPIKFDLQKIKSLKRIYFLKYFNGDKIELYEDKIEEDTYKVYCLISSSNLCVEIMGIYLYNKITSGSIEVVSIEEMLGFQGMFISILNKYIIQSYDYVIINLCRDKGFLYFISLLLSNKSNLCGTKILKILKNSCKSSSENIFNILKYKKTLSNYKLIVKSKYEII